MDNSKISSWKCFMAFVPMSYKILMCIGTVLVSILGFVLSYVLGPLGAAAVSSAVMVIIIILDYIPFSGISIKHQKRMEIFKSSLYGSFIMKRVLKTDLFVKAASAFIIMLSAVVGVLINGDASLLLLPLMYYFVFMAATGFFLILTRRKGLSMLAQVLFCYLASNVGAFVVMILIFGQEIIDNALESTAFPGTILTVTLIVIFAALTFLSGKLVYNDSVNGFESGFSDGADTKQ